MTFELQPTFTTAMRGYDRAQVDEYTTRLRQMLAEAQQGAVAAQRAEEAVPNRNGDAPTQGPDFDALGERIGTMLRLAEEEAADRRRRGQEDAERIVAGAKEEAEEIRRSATLDVEQLRETKAGAQREAKAVLDNAREQAEDLLGRARRHAEDQAEGIIGQAEADARRILDEARESGEARLGEAESRRAELAAETEALEQRHRGILEDLARVRAALDSHPDVVPRPQPESRLEGEALAP